MQESLLEDRQLLQAIGNGDKAAFDHLFQKYYPTLCAYGSRFVELEDAEEIVEDIMLWIWENANMLGFIESSFSFSDVETSISENEIMGQLSEKIEELPKRGRKRTTAEKSNGLKEGRKKKQLQDRGKGRKMNGFKS